MENQSSKQAAHTFAAALAASLSESLTGAIGSAYSLKAVDGPDVVTRKERPLHFRLTVDGPLRGECFIEFYERQVAALGAKLLAQDEAEFSDEHAKALENAIEAALPALSKSLSDKYPELTLTLSRASELAFGGMLVVPLASTLGEKQDLPVILYFDGELLEALAPGSKPMTEIPAPTIDPVNLKLVMDVELNVTLRFGQRRLPLREVLELASGSVIELDRQVDEPVELLLDGKLIARGEAVIVDGNYGLRVTEIPLPMASHFLR